MQIIYNSGMKKYYEGTISCKAILENPQRTCTCLYIDKKKRNREFRYIINLAKNKVALYVFWNGRKWMH